jgi:predicted membrane channel-forming protein YqfA (hemolysin III family)
MAEMTLIWIILALIVAIGIIAVLIAWKKAKKGEKHETDYYTFFLMGIIWTAIGAPYWLLDGELFNPLFALGIVFLIVGLVNKSKWKKKQHPPGKWQVIAIAIGVAALAAGIVALILFRGFI